MENASKALIIAGAILLSILLISLGIMIFNMATPDMDQFDQAEVTSFNQKFSKYEGSVRGTEVRALIQEVLAANKSQSATDDASLQIEIDGTKTPTTSKVKTNGKYSVEITYDGPRRKSKFNKM